MSTHAALPFVAQFSSPPFCFVYFLTACVAGEIVNDRWTADHDETSRLHGAIVIARRTADDDWLSQGSS